MPQVDLPYALQPYCEGRREVDGRGATLREVLRDLARQYPRLGEQLFDDGGRLRPHLTVLIGEEDARRLGGLEAPVPGEERVTILPAVAGGLGAGLSPVEDGLDEALVRSLAGLAERAWPHEACGVVLTGSEPRAVALRNAIATERARRAFALDPEELLRTLRRAESNGERLVAFFHSHGDGSALFSIEDRRAALSPDGAPLWPGVEHLVIGVERGRARRIASYAWALGRFLRTGGRELA